MSEIKINHSFKRVDDVPYSRSQLISIGDCLLFICGKPKKSISNENERAELLHISRRNDPAVF